MRQIQKYIWLINILWNYKSLSYKEISAKWIQNTMLSDGNPLSRATFNRWRAHIEDLFHVKIMCNRALGSTYYIENLDVLKRNDMCNFIIDSLSVGNIIYENLSLKDRILIDHKPSGYIYLQPILSAMKENKVLELSYLSYEYPVQQTFQFEPYCVKLFENRWYILGRNLSKNTLLCYGLDRIVNMSIKETHFKLPPLFSAEKFYQHLYGIVSEGSDKAERIIIRAYKNHKKYLESLPLHHSQQKIAETEEYTDFELYLAPKYDFIMRLLHDGALLEVITPLSLRMGMKGWINDMHDLYNN